MRRKQRTAEIIIALVSSICAEAELNFMEARGHRPFARDIYDPRRITLPIED
jgi:hypothetical protein